MKITVDFLSRIDFLPSRRHRNTCTMYKPGQVDVDVCEPSEKEFPVAFIVKNGYGYSCGKDGKANFEQITKEIRTFGGRLYEDISDFGRGKKARKTSDCTPLSLIRDCIRPIEYRGRSDDITDTAVIVADDSEEKSAQVRKNAEDYLVFRDNAWRVCGEPMYEVVTLGPGHNFGWTGVSVSLIHSENINKGRCFTAFEKEKALSYAREIALRWGDTESVSSIGDGADIEVLMPEMVTRCPQKEHDDSDLIIKCIEELVAKTSCSPETAAHIFLETVDEMVAEMVAMEEQYEKKRKERKRK